MNLGILAHVDAGKTSLTERLLYAAGVIDTIGRVDDGNTQTDTLALERQRGITIKSAVVSFVLADVTVNLIDTPGHPDFIAEVERALNALDGVVLVLSAVEGVQAQTRVLMRTLQRLGIPTVFFVNKIDRRGAEPDRVLRDITDVLTPYTVAMGSVTDAGTRAASVQPHATEPGFRSALVDVLVEHNEALLRTFVADETAVSADRLRTELGRQTRRGDVHPVFFGSALTGAGVAELMAELPQLLPRSPSYADEQVSGTVFKVERGSAGEKIALVRMFSGTVHVRDRLTIGSGEEKVTGIAVFSSGTTVGSPSLTAGQIGRVWGLHGVQIGDAIGLPRARADSTPFAPPTLETVVVPARPAETAAVHEALDQLAEQDPLIDLRQDDERQEVSVSLYGEVQKEVLEATLLTDYGLAVTFRESTTICIERPAGPGAAVELIGQEPNPFLATVGLAVSPAAIGSGSSFELGVELGSMPLAFFTAVQETVVDTLRAGVHGWQVQDCRVVMTHSGYYPRQSHAHATFDKSMSSTAGDFRNLTRLVLMEALRRAGTTVYEPLHRFEIEAPADALGAILPAVAALRGVPRSPQLLGTRCVVAGEIPAARVHELQQQLPPLTRGEGVLESVFDSYRPVRGPVPTRTRSGPDPSNRKEYLLAVERRVPTRSGRS